MMGLSVADICITKNDYAKLMSLLESPESGARLPSHTVLARDLKKAKKVDGRKISPDHITMNSTFKLTDLGTGESFTYTLVFPQEEDVKKGKISVLSPEGSTALGCKTGNVLRWKFPKGEKYLQISKILFQPDASGKTVR